MFSEESCEVFDLMAEESCEVSDLFAEESCQVWLIFCKILQNLTNLRILKDVKRTLVTFWSKKHIWLLIMAVKNCPAFIVNNTIHDASLHTQPPTRFQLSLESSNTHRPILPYTSLPSSKKLIACYPPDNFQLWQYQQGELSSIHGLIRGQKIFWCFTRYRGRGKWSFNFVNLAWFLIVSLPRDLFSFKAGLLYALQRTM